MSIDKDGGPAFPGIDPYVDHPSHGRIHREQIGESISSGMTMRDFFAAQAMKMKFGFAGTNMSKDQMAVECYDMADAMLRAREQS